MANLVIKPASGSTNKLILQNQTGAVDAITVEDSGATTLAGNVTMSGTANNLGTITAGTFPAGHIVKVTTFGFGKYSISGPDASGGNRSAFVQLTSQSWDVILKQANSKMLIMGYWTMGGYGSHGYFDLKFNDTTWLGGPDGTYDGMHSDHKVTDDKMNISIQWVHDPGTNAANTTLNYKPYIGQHSGTETIEINGYSSGNSNQNQTSQFHFLELGV
jgi:hypothetical protein